MERVSFKVAQAIKEAGYPQEGGWYYSPDGRIGEVVPDPEDYLAPTYLDVWLWLWREKNIYIDIDVDYVGRAYAFIKSFHNDMSGIFKANYPEEAITKAIGHLVDNDLIK